MMCVCVWKLNAKPWKFRLYTFLLLLKQNTNDWKKTLLHWKRLFWRTAKWYFRGIYNLILTKTQPKVCTTRSCSRIKCESGSYSFSDAELFKTVARVAFSNAKTSLCYWPFLLFFSYCNGHTCETSD